MILIQRLSFLVSVYWLKLAADRSANMKNDAYREVREAHINIFAYFIFKHLNK